MSKPWKAIELARCIERCAEVGDPPCWEIVADDEPCEHCRSSRQGKPNADD